MVKTLIKAKIKIHCDHCHNECENVWICKLVSIIGTRYALLCTYCQKLIGVYSSKDFNELLIASNIIFDELQNPLN